MAHKYTFAVEAEKKTKIIVINGLYQPVRSFTVTDENDNSLNAQYLEFSDCVRFCSDCTEQTKHFWESYEYIRAEIKSIIQNTRIVYDWEGFNEENSTDLMIEINTPENVKEEMENGCFPFSAIARGGHFDESDYWVCYDYNECEIFTIPNNQLQKFIGSLPWLAD